MKVTFKNLTPSEREEFSRGFRDACGSLQYLDNYSDVWERPWEYPWDESLCTEFQGTTPYGWGCEWFKRNYKVILAVSREY